ncbi:UDP-glucuronate 4-epimerase [Porphyromonadaceae bacterium NLAE-zl-C104]|nr:UDP-glucuronate 4-epimerase [Porphyromonadaceae bacterium NLAE-zl-C104]
MKYLVTGAAGFIGFHVCKYLLTKYPDIEIIGLDNINTYYDINLKFGRLQELGINSQIDWHKCENSSIYPKFKFIRVNLEDKLVIQKLFTEENFDIIVHLAAQAGVRYSIENPYSYIKSNIEGFLNIMEECRCHNIKHLVYASSSSVYGLNGKTPFSEKDGIAHPVSLYAATKKANELIAHSYSHLYQIPSTGLRFFTVYGPWGRPDMSPFLFTDAILNNRPIKIFNNGNMLRDFTYIDDIIDGIIRVINHPPSPSPEWDKMHPDPSISSAPYRIYNIGNSEPIQLMEFISAIEEEIEKTGEKIYLPMQQGDVYQTYADTNAIQDDLGFKPRINLKEGVKRTIEWYRSFYNK